MINDSDGQLDQGTVVPEFVVDEEASPSASPQLKEAVCSVIRREYALRQSLIEKNLSMKEEMFCIAHFLKQLLEAKETRCDKLIETFRARQAEGVEISPEEEVWLKRIERIQAELDRVLEAYGVQCYVSSGRAQPGRDDIEGTVPDTGEEPGIIVRVLKSGYLWRGEMLRLPVVLVAE